MTFFIPSAAVVARKAGAVAILSALLFGLGSAEALAQYPSRTVGPGNGPQGGWNGGLRNRGTTFRPGAYNPVWGNAIQHNSATNSTYMPGVGVAKPSGFYEPAGNGYYRNPRTGNVYNPATGSYTRNRNLQFKGGVYNPALGNAIQYNPVTGSTYIPGVGVSKPSGVYRPMGNGYYRNPHTGNVYNPSTGAYFSR
jgi:hypothetical protein